MPGQTGPKVASCVCVLWECASLGSKQEQKDPWQGEPTLLGGGGWNGLRTPVKMWALHLRTEGKLNTHLEGRRAIDCLSFFLFLDATLLNCWILLRMKHAPLAAVVEQILWNPNYEKQT